MEDYADIDLPKLHAYVEKLSNAATSARLEAEVQIAVPCLGSKKYQQWYQQLWSIEEDIERLEQVLLKAMQ